jgi:hypothetical protein
MIKNFIIAFLSAVVLLSQFGNVIFRLILLLIDPCAILVSTPPFVLYNTYIVHPALGNKPNMLLLMILLVNPVMLLMENLLEMSGGLHCLTCEEPNFETWG